jgi:hypothetical protein
MFNSPLLAGLKIIKKTKAKANKESWNMICLSKEPSILAKIQGVGTFSR